MNRSSPGERNVLVGSRQAALFAIMAIAALSPAVAAAETPPTRRAVPAAVIADVRKALAAAPHYRELYAPSLTFGERSDALCGLVDARRRGVPRRFTYVKQGSQPAVIEIDDGADVTGFDNTWRSSGCVELAGR